MSEKNVKSQKKNMSLALIVVLVAAIAVIAVLFVRANGLDSQLDSLSNELTETTATLNKTIADKEAVEAELKSAEESLREARLTLEESTQKVTDLEGQLTALTTENNANKAQIALLTADLETAKANKEAAEVYLATVESSIQMALNALNGITPAPTAEPTPEPTAEPVEETAAEADAVSAVTDYTLIHEDLTVNFSVDGNAISAISVSKAGTPVADPNLGRLLMMTLPIDVEALQLEEGSIVLTVVTLMNGVELPVTEPVAETVPEPTATPVEEAAEVEATLIPEPTEAPAEEAAEVEATPIPEATESPVEEAAEVEATLIPEATDEAPAA